MILTNTDYSNFYLGTDRHAKQLFAILATYRICFLGFSLTDPHVLRLLEQVQALGYEAPRHFAVLPDPGHRMRAIKGRMLEKRFGVAPIFYRQGRGRDTHRNFPHLLSQLVAACAQHKNRETAAASAQPSTSSIATSAPRKGSDAPFWPALTRSVDADDPTRGRFGRRKSRDGLLVDAVIKPIRKEPEWFDVVLTVRADPKAGSAVQPLRNGQRVRFHLHPTFRQPVVSVRVQKGVARLNRYAWGAFTVGVEIPDRTCLEIDLSEKKDAPAKFRGR